MIMVLYRCFTFFLDTACSPQLWLICLRAAILVQFAINLSKCLPVVMKTSPQNNLRRACHKGPIGYNETPQINPPKLPFLHRQSPLPSNTPILRPTPLTTQQHPDPFSRFATIHSGQTDRQTDTQKHTQIG